MKKVAIVAAALALGVASALVVTRTARAWLIDDLNRLGYTTWIVVDTQAYPVQCAKEWVQGYGGPPTELGDPRCIGADVFQARIDAYVAAWPFPPSLTATTSTTAPPPPGGGGGGTTTKTNLPPTADFSATFVGAAGSFSASATDDGVVSSYVWSFGDGSNATGAAVDHVYAAGGNYVVVLTVVDDGGLVAQVGRQLHVDPAGPTSVGPLRLIARGETLPVAARCNAGAFADHACTPGATVKATRKQVCSDRWVSLRPHVSSAQRARVLAAYGIRTPAGYLIDHLVPLALGGATTDANLWPVPAVRAKTKAARAAQLRRGVCRGALSLAEAQAVMRTYAR